MYVEQSNFLSAIIVRSYCFCFKYVHPCDLTSKDSKYFRASKGRMDANGICLPFKKGLPPTKHTLKFVIVFFGHSIYAAIYFLLLSNSASNNPKKK
ncbi:hypothetical protein NQ317_011567 [Molorchus minor]|uniref:Transmembrane protein n=1 Tax=Molorchus minor TaxID=1323400 RepID=A0ABQ9JS78_9CUCU|nr:hypothetical protein NQ317_011567 [Molorchus minor]